MSTLYAFLGGRKQANTYLALVICLIYAAISGPDFLTFAGVVGGILGVGSFAVAWEDRGKGPAP